MFKAHTFNPTNINHGRVFDTFEEALEVVERSARAGDDAEFILWGDEPGKTIVSLAGDPDDAPSGMVEEV